MNPLLIFLIQTFAPVIAEALLALIKAIEQAGVQPDPTIGFATEVVRGLENSEVLPNERRDRAADAISLHMKEQSGLVPSRATCNALVEIALQKVRAVTQPAPASAP